MAVSSSGRMNSFLLQLKRAFTGPPALAFLPALTLGAFWMGGETALLLCALGLPLIAAIAGAMGILRDSRAVATDSVTGLIMRDGFDDRLSQIYDDTEINGLKSACFLLELDDFKTLTNRHGQSAADALVQRTGDRLVSVLRDGDTVARLGDSRFAICLDPVRQLDLELCIQLSGRMQAAVEEPVPVDGLTIYLSCSIGFCPRSRTPGTSSEEWLAAADAALNEAISFGASSIRAFSTEMHRKSKTRSDLRDEAAAALENGQIQPWFQPQISTDTGKVTGFEALARWTHPVHGIVPPDVFLPALEEAGLMERLGEVILYHAMTALKAWDAAGADVPRVGVNFSNEELQNPRLVDKIRWEIDRFDLAPDRLTVEILESVVSDGPDDIVTRNISGLHDLGCRIDLDDFGTGNASISAIRRFQITRIKIDRSFVSKADRDPDQQRLVGAILTMAERLGLETLAEGVETVGEHALLAQLGCNHVQGFGIARPMPFDQTLDWISAHDAKLQDAPRIGRQTG